MEIKNCPFCDGKAEINSRYDSDDNRPDGEQIFVECLTCGSKSGEFYAVTTNSIHLKPQQKKEQDDYYNCQRNEAIRAWNKRVFPTQNYKYT